MDRCRLPWSRRLPSRFLEGRCNIKHQLMMETSYLVMETHASSTPVQLCATCLCLPKSKAKENGHCQKNILPRLWTTIWQRKAVWKTLFQNKSSGTINPVYLPQNSWTTQRMCQSTKHCLVQLLPNTLSCNLWGTSHEQQWHLLWSILENMQWKEMHELLYFGLGVGWHWKASAWTSETWNLHKPTKIINSSTVAGTLTGVLLNLSNPDWFWRSRSAWASL